MGDDVTITWQDFEKVDIRIGTIIKVQDFPEARKPAYILHVDFGSEIGIKKSSSQITDLYNKDQLKDKQVMGVVNFSPKQVGPIMSECLVLGFYRQDNSVVLATNDLPIDNGSRLLQFFNFLFIVLQSNQYLLENIQFILFYNIFSSNIL